MPRVLPRLKKRTKQVGSRVLRYDPTHTITLRNAFCTEMRRRFNQLKGDIVKLISGEDALGIREPKRFSLNAFCPTGPGGGQDNSCSPSNKGGGVGKNEQIKIEINGNLVDVYKNPDSNGLKNIVRASEAVKGYIAGDQVYVWDSPWDSVRHDSVVAKLKLEPTEGYAVSDNKFFVTSGYSASEPIVIHGVGDPEDQTQELKDWVKSIGATLNLSSTQFNIADDSVQRAIERLQEALDPDDVVELEDTPHITVRYGLHTQDTFPVQSLYQNTGPIRVSLSGLSLFQTPEHDVLKIDIESQHLAALHGRLGILPNTNTHHTYKPHLTVAYLKPGTGYKYIGRSGLEGVQLTFDELVFSNDEREHTVLQNTRWKFSDNPDKVEKFRQWMEKQTQIRVTGQAGEERAESWWTKYIRQGLKKGTARAWDDVKKPGLLPEAKKQFGIGAKDQFLASAMNRPTTLQQVKLLAGRTYSDLVGVTKQMEMGITRALTDGLVMGHSPETIARNMTQVVDKLGIASAERIARTEIVRAHAEGQLDAMEELGVDEVGVAVEWDTTDNPCPACKSMEGVVLSIQEARGLIPRHPNCFISGHASIFTADGWKPIRDVEIGELVLTHEGRFRKVIQLHRNKSPKAGVRVVSFWCSCGGYPKKVTVTGDHPVMVNGDWIAAKEIKPGDVVTWLSSNCKSCGADLFYGQKYCNQKCQWADKDQKENMGRKITAYLNEAYATGQRNGKEDIKAAHARIRELVALGQFDHPRPSGENNASKRPEVRRIISEGKRGDKNPMRVHKEIGRANGKVLAQFIRDHPEKHANAICAKKGYRTKIERKMEIALNECGLGWAMYQCPVDGLWVDFALVKKKIAIECDGVYWHQDQDKEAKRDERLEQLGWTVLHFTDKQINRDIEGCIKKILRVLKNHDGEYKFSNFEVVQTKHRIVYGRRLYNLSVDEDESYVAKGGCVVHNCQCAFLPANIGENAKDQIRSKTMIQKAIRGSLRAVGETKRDSSWQGAGKRIAKKRPKITYNALGHQRRTYNGYTIKPMIHNVFCATGEGGGVDPTCSSSSGVGSRETSIKAGAAKVEISVGRFSDWETKFSTQAGNKYTVEFFESSPRDSDTGLYEVDVGFIDKGGSYGLTGAGSAREVLTRATESVFAFINQKSPNIVKFSAKEKSRAKLYDRLTRTLSKLLPDKSALAFDLPGTGRVYYLVDRKSKDLVKSLLETKRSVPVEILVNRFNPAWFGSVSNVYCATGQGGGVDPTCSTGSGGSSKYIGARVDGKIHSHAEKTKHFIAEAIGGTPEELTKDQGQKDKKPYDVQLRSKGEIHDIEVKSMTVGAKQQISVHPDALLRKYEHVQKVGSTFHTVVVDDRATYGNGTNKENYSGHRLYYKRGSGRYSLTQMHQVKDQKELRKLIKAKDRDLPEKARGSLPPPPPIKALKQQAGATHESRKARDSVRKERNYDLLLKQAKARYRKAKAAR